MRIEPKEITKDGKAWSISSVISRLFHFHKWEDITDYSSKMTPLPDGVEGYCQWKHTMKCNKCEKEKSFLGDCHAGMTFID
jgi:hypothetical protein